MSSYHQQSPDRVVCEDSGRYDEHREANKTVELHAISIQSISSRILHTIVIEVFQMSDKK